jgi:glycosyltransferase involved in cell wall biosynthesis
MKISIVSDVPWGYGSPQIGYLRDSLLAEAAEIQYLVPSYPDRPLLTSNGVSQVFSEGNPFTWEGMIAFGKRAAALIEKFAPDKLIIVNPRSLTVLPYLKSRDRALIYYGLEPILDHGVNFMKAISFQKFNFSLGVFPNIERAQTDAQILSLPAPRVRILRNVPKLSKFSESNSEKKIVTYAGALDWTWVNFHVLEKAASIVPLEIWGHTSRKIEATISKSYRGKLPHSNIGVAYESSAISLVVWNPINFGTRNAAPNKFFEAMSYGVPSVSFPYPQVVEFVTKYGIGFVSKDFSKESFLKTLREAYKLVPSDQFKEMRHQCVELHKTRLNWEIESNSLVKEIISDK